MPESQNMHSQDQTDFQTLVGDLASIRAATKVPAFGLAQTWTLVQCLTLVVVKTSNLKLDRGCIHLGDPSCLFITRDGDKRIDSDNKIDNDKRMNDVDSQQQTGWGITW